VTIFTFDTTHHALWAEEVAAEEAIPVEVVPAPPELRARCNIALRTLPALAAGLSLALDGAGIPHLVTGPPDAAPAERS
jgi:hypothetical protein